MLEKTKLKRCWYSASEKIIEGIFGGYLNIPSAEQAKFEKFDKPLSLNWVLEFINRSKSDGHKLRIYKIGDMPTSFFLSVSVGFWKTYCRTRLVGCHSRVKCKVMVFTMAENDRPFTVASFLDRLGMFYQFRITKVFNQVIRVILAAVVSSSFLCSVSR